MSTERTHLEQPPPSFIKVWSDKLHQLGIAAPAVLFLEFNKPLSFVWGQFLLMGQPLLNTFLPRQFTQNAVNLLSDRTRLEQFIKELEGR